MDARRRPQWPRQAAGRRSTCRPQAGRERSPVSVRRPPCTGHQVIHTHRPLMQTSRPARGESPAAFCRRESGGSDGAGKQRKQRWRSSRCFRRRSPGCLSGDAAGVPRRCPLPSHRRPRPAASERRRVSSRVPGGENGFPGQRLSWVPKEGRGDGPSSMPWDPNFWSIPGGGAPRSHRPVTQQ